LSIVKQIHENGGVFISGALIAEAAGVEPIQVRKDLSLTGVMGKPKKGYAAADVISAIERFLGWNSMREAVLAGAGNLGSAIMGHKDFKAHGLTIVAAFDKDGKVTGKKIHGVEVFHINTAREKIRELGVKTAILTTPPQEAQKVAAVLSESGIEAIWNFTNVILKAPKHIAVRNEDLSSGYALLCVMAHSGRNAAKTPDDAGAGEKAKNGGQGL
jgi:redox-sensing transcriptional repressor